MCACVCYMTLKGTSKVLFLNLEGDLPREKKKPINFNYGKSRSIKGEDAALCSRASASW